MITLDLRSNPGLHLLEPYQWALACQAMSEGLAKHLGKTQDRNIDRASADEIAAMLQLLVLNDTISISYKPEENIHKRGGVAPIDLSPLAGTGLVRFIDPPLFDIDHSDGLRSKWEKIRPYLERYEPFILAQFEARGYTAFSHWAIYRYIIASRTGNPVMASLVEPSLLPEDYSTAATVARQLDQPDTETFVGLDLKFFNAARRVHQAFTLAERGDVRVARASPSLNVPGLAGRAEAAVKIWQFAVSALVEERIEFPVPTSLQAASRLRSLPEVRAFREFLCPFIDGLVAGEVKVYKELRKEIKAAVRGINLLPGVKRVLDWTAYAGVPVSVIEAMTGAIGPSIVIGVAAVGLAKLAKQWEQQTRWLYLAADGRHT